MLGLALVIISIFSFGRNRRAAIEPPASEFERGERLYTQHCAACHGENGEGYLAADVVALDGSEDVWRQTDGQLQRIIREGGETMPALGDQLSEGDSAAIIRYYQTWWTAAQRQEQRALSADDPLKE